MSVRPCYRCGQVGCQDPDHRQTKPRQQLRRENIDRTAEAIGRAYREPCPTRLDSAFDAAILRAILRQPEHWSNRKVQEFLAGLARRIPKGKDE
jgi:hypothetical protein